MKTLYEVLMDMYPWLSEEDARRLATECEIKSQQHAYNEAQRLKPN